MCALALTRTDAHCYVGAVVARVEDPMKMMSENDYTTRATFVLVQRSAELLA
jgi:hypothetical protein